MPIYYDDGRWHDSDKESSRSEELCSWLYEEIELLLSGLGCERLEDGRWRSHGVEFSFYLRPTA